MNVLVDSSVWIDYFRDTGCADTLSFLIEENLIVVNDLILSEILPLLLVQKETELVVLLREVNRQPMNIDWEEITISPACQYTFLTRTETLLFRLENSCARGNFAENYAHQYPMRWSICRSIGP